MELIPIVLAAVLTMLNITLAAHNIRREWRNRRQPPTHPLEGVLRDIAGAIRERRP